MSSVLVPAPKGRIDKWEIVNRCSSGNEQYAAPEQFFNCVHGIITCSERYTDGDEIWTSEIKAIKGNMLMTKSGSLYLLGKPKEKEIEEVKHIGEIVNELVAHPISMDDDDVAVVFDDGSYITQAELGAEIDAVLTEKMVEAEAEKSQEESLREQEAEAALAETEGESPMAGVDLGTLRSSWWTPMMIASKFGTFAGLSKDEKPVVHAPFEGCRFALRWAEKGIIQFFRTFAPEKWGAQWEVTLVDVDERGQLVGNLPA